MDHSYSKPWRPEASHVQPTRSLFINKLRRTPPAADDEDDRLNIELDPVKPVPPYDPQQARQAMSECERYVSFANPDIEGVSTSGWEEAVPKEGWTQLQKTLYSKMVKVLHQDRLSRLAQEGRDNEPVVNLSFLDYLIHTDILRNGYKMKVITAYYLKLNR